MKLLGLSSHNYSIYIVTSKSKVQNCPKTFPTYLSVYPFLMYSMHDALKHPASKAAGLCLLA